MPPELENKRTSRHCADLANVVSSLTHSNREAARHLITTSLMETDWAQLRG